MASSLHLGIYAIMISFVAGIIFCPILIPLLHRLKFGQAIREEGPKSHQKKSGTPTMGGIAILLAFTATSLIFVRNNPAGGAVLLATLGFGLIGFIDDYIKVVKKRNLGLRAYQKLLGQLVITVVFIVFMRRSGLLSTEVVLPFTGGKTWDMGALYYPFVFIVLLGTTNGVNLTDGLDGLASGVTMIVAVFFMLAAWGLGSGVYPVAGAAIGSLLAFLVFNSYPAQVFMGDTGSLALGGFVASLALVLGLPWFIIIVGFVYLGETLSVMIQVGVSKATHKRKKVFKMAPIHHHFELCGWSETKVVTVFYVVTALLCMVGYLAL